MKTLTILSAFLLCTPCFAQVDKKIVLEHFTNTRCGICANRNPDLFTNLDDNPDVIHLAIHPSSPYDECLFNDYNESENDARTNFYGVYGSTPRIVIQGEVQAASVDFSSASLFTNYESEQSNFSISISQEYINEYDSIKTTVTITKEAADATTSALLFVALAEANIEYDAPNGETHHEHVFRNSLFGTDGQTVDLPSGTGESTVYVSTLATDAEWNMAEVYATAILQDESNNEVIQAESSEGQEITGINDRLKNVETFTVYPNPASQTLNLSIAQVTDVTFSIIDIRGNIVSSGKTTNGAIDISNLPNGMFIATCKTEKTISRARFTKN